MEKFKEILWWAIPLSIVALVAIAGNLLSDPQNYDRSLANTLVSEGNSRYTNHPSDPGGPTKYGITIHDVRLYLKKGATAQDVKNLTEAQAKAIYRKHYWEKVKGDALPKGLDYTVFDYSVNAGDGRAIPAARACIRQHVTVNPVDVFQLINCVNDKRMSFQMGLGSKFNVFKRGWRSRINSVRAISLNMAGKTKASLGGDLNLIPRQGPGKAYEEGDQ